ncbi:unnamed protein product [Lactuca virosa]|uniref:Uncharacterized protein n=1 Tax=Lactuca virosa TaxID=75947 RepID=A0AAU9NJ89_9ASTR|nr:unnamed protein product [Lactuca virosa]
MVIDVVDSCSTTPHLLSGTGLFCYSSSQSSKIDIHIFRGRFPETQDHVANSALDDQIALGVLDTLPPLLHVLRSGSDSPRHDSALALCPLSLVQRNRSSVSTW